MSLIDPTARTEAMLGFHDPTLEVGAYARDESGGAAQGEEDGFFSTLLDVINPLQHIPLVSNLYREITGDEISPSARLIGGGLFGGPIGFASASANVILEQASGDDLLGHALAMFTDDPDLAPLQAGPANDGVNDPPNDGPSIHEQADAGGHAETGIVLAGPPALASLRAAPVSLAPPVATPPEAVKPAVIDQAINNGPQTAPAPNTVEAQRALPTNWVNEALRDAQTMNQALQSGAAPEIGGPKPWVGNAMLDALSKYEALTRARHESALNGPS